MEFDDKEQRQTGKKNVPNSRVEKSTKSLKPLFFVTPAKIFKQILEIQLKAVVNWFSLFTGDLFSLQTKGNCCHRYPAITGLPYIRRHFCVEDFPDPVCWHSWSWYFSIPSYSWISPVEITNRTGWEDIRSDSGFGSKHGLVKKTYGISKVMWSVASDWIVEIDDLEM